MTRLVILASGRDEPFEGYDVPKHLLPINGEPILHRQIEQWLARGIEDIRIAGRYRYVHPFVSTFDPRTQPGDVDIASSVPAWNPDGRTIVTYGDCVYTEAACDTIVNVDYERYIHFCRPHDRERFAEGLAVSFYPEQHEFLRLNIERLPHLVAADVTWRADGWAISRLMDRVSLDKLGEHDPYLKCYMVIDDESDDIDTADEYEQVKAAFE
jgi:hypothetical protein